MTFGRSRSGLLAIVALYAATGCQVSESHASAAVTTSSTIAVALVTVGERAVPRYLQLTGTLAAHRRARVGADGSGRVLATLIEPGVTVEEGATLVRLDARSARLSRAEARARAAAAETERERAQAECARAEQLYQRGVLESQEHERTRAACSVSHFDAVAARARQDQAAHELDDTIVRAPFSGTIDELLVTVGEHVRPGQAVAVLVDVAELRLELSVPESAVALVHPGQMVELRVAAYPGRVFVGQVAHVPASLRRPSRDLIVEAIVANPDGALRPGMFASARLESGARATTVVPELALRPAAGGASARVFVVRDGRLEERLVATGEPGPGGTPVLAGLTSGERIVARVTRDLHDGQAVAVH